MKVKILIADDHQVFVDGLSAMLSQDERFLIVGSANNGVQLIERARQLKPDIILTDIQMPELNGVDATRSIVAEGIPVKVIALSMISESLYVKKMFDAGACGYLLKTTDKEELMSVILKVHRGEKHYDQILFESLMKKELEHNNAAVLLSKREKEILALIAAGLTDKEIAEKVFLSPLTVITHRKNILGKLNLKNKVELTRFAIDNGLL